MKDIPGFYFDPEKKRYFKITRPGQSGGTSSQAQYTSGSIRAHKRRKVHNDKKTGPSNQKSLAELLVCSRLGGGPNIYGWYIKQLKSKRTLSTSLRDLTRIGGSRVVGSSGSELVSVDHGDTIISEDRARLGPIVHVFATENAAIGYVTKYGAIGVVGTLGERRKEAGEAGVFTAQYLGGGSLLVVYEDHIALTGTFGYRMLNRGGLGSDVLAISSDGLLGLRNGKLWSAERVSFIKRHGSRFSHGSTITHVIQLGKFYVISGLKDSLVLYDQNFNRLIKYRGYCNESKIEHGMDCFDDFVAVACDDNSVRIWHIWTGQLVTRIPVRGHVHSLVFAADGKLILALDHTVQVYG